MGEWFGTAKTHVLFVFLAQTRDRGLWGEEPYFAFSMGGGVFVKFFLFRIRGLLF